MNRPKLSKAQSTSCSLKSHKLTACIASLIITSVLPISHPVSAQVLAETKGTDQTRSNPLLSQSQQFQTGQVGAGLNPSWQLGTIVVYTIGNKQGGHSLPVRCVAFHPSGRFFASGSADKTIKIWDLEAQTLVRTLANTSEVTSVSFSPDGQFLASGSLDGSKINGTGTVRLWNWQQGKLIKTFPKHSDIVTSVTFSPDSQTLASSSGDKTIKLWNVGTGDLRREILEKQWVTSVAFSPDGQTLASGGLGMTVELWDPETGKQVRTLGRHAKAVYSVAFSPDGKTLASGSGDKTIKLWDLSSEDFPRTLEGHIDYVSSIAFSPNGQTLISGSWDKTIKLWNLLNRQRIRDFLENSRRILSVAFSPDGRTFASVSGDKTIKIWRSRQ